MNQPSDILPSFDDPPVVEVVLGVQFDPISGLRTPQLGLLWQEFRDRLPVLEEKPPLEPVIERFGAAWRPAGPVALQVFDVPPVPRCWFLNEQGTVLIQVQPDRFIHNWRKIPGDNDYPRYEHLREAFLQESTRFLGFVERAGLGAVIPNQCEVTYVNHILSGDAWRDHGEADRVLSVLRAPATGFPGRPEDLSLQLRYVIPNSRGEPVGRLHVSLEPVFRTTDDLPMFRLSLTARGCPDGGGMEGVLRFFDLGREWVVRTFASITTPEMHKTWRRHDGR